MVIKKGFIDKMKYALLISETELDEILEESLVKLRQKAYLISAAIDFNSALNLINHKNQLSKFDLVIINGENRRLEALELAKLLSSYKLSQITVVTYMTKASLNEASRFGAYGSFLEDSHSIVNFLDHLNERVETKYQKKNLISIVGLDTNKENTYLLLSLAKYLSLLDKRSLISETDLHPRLKFRLGVKHFKSLLHESNTEAIFDYNWLKSYLEPSSISSKTFYLSLFDKVQYKLNNTINLERLNTAIDISIEKFDFHLIDLGSDLHSQLNLELLKRTRYLIININAEPFIDQTYKELKSFLEKEFALECYCVLHCESKKQAKKYSQLNAEEWLEVLNELPVIVSELGLELNDFLGSKQYQKNLAYLTAKSLLEKFQFFLNEAEETKEEKKCFSLN